AFKAHRSLDHCDPALRRDPVHKGCCGDRPRNRITPTTRLREITDKQCDYLVWRNERTIAIQNSETVGIAVSGDSEVTPVDQHLVTQFVQVLSIRFGTMAAKVDIA